MNSLRQNPGVRGRGFSTTGEIDPAKLARTAGASFCTTTICYESRTSRARLSSSLARSSSNSRASAATFSGSFSAVIFAHNSSTRFSLSELIIGRPPSQAPSLRSSARGRGPCGHAPRISSFERAWSRQENADRTRNRVSYRPFRSNAEVRCWPRSGIVSRKKFYRVGNVTA